MPILYEEITSELATRRLKDGFNPSKLGNGTVNAGLNSKRHQGGKLEKWRVKHTPDFEGSLLWAQKNLR